MQKSKKQAKYTIPWLLLSEVAKMNQVLGQTLVLDHTQIWVSLSLGHQPRSPPPPKGKNKERPREVLLRPLVTKLVVSVGVGLK